MARKAKHTYETESEPFPMRLRELIKENGITQSELAEKIGITRQAISLYATGQSSPDIKTFEKIVEYFDTSADYMLGKAECLTPDNNEIHKKLGLSKQAIDRLENVSESLEKGFMMKEKLDACNFIIENFNNSDFLRNLHSYVFKTFAFPDPDDDNKVVFTTEIVSGTGDGNTKTNLLNSKDINDAFLVKVQHDIVELKNKYLDETE